ncbi:MAG: hypothetical protein HC886_06955 [Leptolyngbyaceae cyanobacterium SM1_1_3]|nr:hypothetical protein [Leptolyngbyaceae cyanobacterium SM1_1_3]NJN01170.1 hypothetical protein [Leptolyngbyaceae cyanobacterium RM1_1_2]NJO09251.1 hypothetical protein [Leptolyngbyaceae cyanobacterium SL_1_1]
MVYQPDRHALSQAQLTTAPVKSRLGVSFTIAAKSSVLEDSNRSRPVELPDAVDQKRDRSAPSLSALPVVFPGGDLPALPKLKQTTFSSHRHEANPAFAMTLWQEIGSNIEQWQSELHKIVLQIQAVYMEGPIVDGWLESEAVQSAQSSGISHSQASVLRHGDVEQIQAYIETQIGQTAMAVDVNVSSQQPPQYRLCNLDAEGRLNCHFCPAEQLSAVSVAIARHQKIRQLLSQKQYLEARLKRAVEVLAAARSELGLSTEAT